MSPRRWAAAAIAVLAAGLMPVLAGTPAQASSPGRNGLIVYSKFDTSADLYTVNANGTARMT